MRKNCCFGRTSKGNPLRRTPLWNPTWARGDPRGPQNDVYLNGMKSKTRHAANAHCGARGKDEIARQPKVYLSPTNFHVQFRYPKTKPLLLPIIINAAKAASGRKGRSNAHPFDGRKLAKRLVYETIHPPLSPFPADPRTPQECVQKTIAFMLAHPFG